MEALISAVVSDIVSRAISIMFGKCREEDLQRLHQLLMRISAVVEEANGRCVTNRGMVRHISTVKEHMFRGYFLLDAFRCRENKMEDKEVSFAKSKFNPAKSFRHLSSNSQIESTIIGRDSRKELKQVILVLENMVVDMKEFAIFLMSYPRIYRQHYGAYLFLDKCMFGRQMEREQAISFLLHAETLGNEKIGVLAIVGPPLVGKSTLVEHVCYDDRVRDHFSSILLYMENDLKDDAVTTFRDNCVIKHQNEALDGERSLLVIELLGDVDRVAWKRLLQSAERCMTHGSKIIITSRSEKTISFGTTKALRLNYLSKEAYWYFFRMLVFGSTDPEEHPKLTSIAMEIACEMCGSFMFAYIVATLLKANLSARFWCRVLRHLTEHRRKNRFLLGEYEYPLVDRPRYVWSMAKTWRGSENIKFFICGVYQKRPASHGEVPKITAVDLLSGTWSAMPQGKFEILSWKSRIPPYYIYTANCQFVRRESGLTLTA
ncbi:hypothetical protein ACQ4PT_014519 [Festuca glaucescens]